MKSETILDWLLIKADSLSWLSIFQRIVQMNNINIWLVEIIKMNSPQKDLIRSAWKWEIIRFSRVVWKPRYSVWLKIIESQVIFQWFFRRMKSFDDSLSIEIPSVIHFKRSSPWRRSYYFYYSSENKNHSSNRIWLVYFSGG